MAEIDLSGDGEQVSKIFEIICEKKLEGVLGSIGTSDKIPGLNTESIENETEDTDDELVKDDVKKRPKGRTSRKNTLIKTLSDAEFPLDIHAFEVFVNTLNSKKDVARITSCVYYLEKLPTAERPPSITLQHVYSCYKRLGDYDYDFKKGLSNASGKNTGYLSVEGGVLSTSSKGKTYVQSLTKGEN